jgi:hypothetical protein
MVHHFRSMDSTSVREPRVLWSFWIACGLAATGGLAPLLLAAGGTNRIAGVVIPFGLAALALAVDALMYHQGRPLATALYFVAGIALVYGMLQMIQVPLLLAVLGNCSSTASVACPPGSVQPLTSGENSGLAVGIAMGILAILVGFFGLLMLFRIRPQPSTPPPTRRVFTEAPPDRTDSTKKPVVTAPADAVQSPPPPVLTEPETVPPVAPVPAFSAPSPDPAVPAPPPPSKPARKPRAKRVPKPQAELPPPEAPLELSAPEDPLELPASSSPDESPPNPRSPS